MRIFIATVFVGIQILSHAAIDISRCIGTPDNDVECVTEE